jgi:TonB-linked SusC/RagA family outer membrane protein
MQLTALCKASPYFKPTGNIRVIKKRGPLTTQMFLFMKFTVILLFAASLQLSARTFSQEVTLSLKNASLEKVFAEVEKQTGYSFVYSRLQLVNTKPVDLAVSHALLDKVLQMVFKNQPLSYTIEKKFVVVKLKEETDNAAVTVVMTPIDIHGIIRDENGKPVADITVRVKGTNKVTSTNSNGEFTLANVDPGATLLITSVNTIPIELAVNGKKNFSVSLKPKVAVLSDVTVNVVNTGYQTLSKERSAGSFSNADMNIVNNRSTSMNIIQRLDGTIPGLVLNNAPSTIDNGKSDPSTRSNILIRGLSSINAAKAPLYVVDGIALNDVSDVNPNDVQDVTVLKDATAASIWGSRASNGVIVITTKKGTRGGQIKVEYNGFINMQGKPDLNYLPYMRSPQFIATMKELFADPAYLTANTYASANTTLNGNNPIAPHETILYQQYGGQISAATANAKLDSLASIDNFQQIKDIWYRNASLMNHTISVRGGIGNYSVYGSLAYTNTVDNTPGNANNAYKLYVRQDIIVNKYVSAFLISNLVNTVSSSGRTASVTNRFLPYQLFEDKNGNSISMPWLYRTDSLTNLYQNKSGVNLDYNPINEMKYGNTKVNAFNSYITTGFTVKLIKGLRFEGVYGIVKGTTKTTAYDSQNSFLIRNQLASFTVPATITSGAPTYYLPTTGGQLVTTNLNNQRWTLRNQFTYDYYSKNNLHQLTLLAGQEATDVFSNTNTSVAMGYNPQLLTSQPVDYVTLNTGITGTVFPSSIFRSALGYNAYSESETDMRTTSLYGNGAYTYQRKYTINASLRNDQSNLFGIDRSAQAKPIWSVGLAWQLRRETFMHSIKWIDNLSLRATYGLTGNQPLLASGSSFDILSGGTNTAAYGGASLGLSSYANRNLSWESTQTTNLGIDFAVLKGRLSGSGDLYFKRTTNLIGVMPVNAFTGTSSITGNLGNINNTGLEARITSINIQKRNFTWSSTFVLAYNVNKVTKLYVSSPTTSALLAMLAHYVQGYSSFAEWGYHFKGLDNLGDPLVQLANKTITKAPGALASDLGYMGTFQPTTTGGFSNNFRYGNFQLAFNMVYDFGSTLQRDAVGLNAATASLTGRTSPSGGYFFGNMYRDFDKRWKVPGDETKTDIPSYVANSSISSTRRYIPYYTNGDINFFNGAYIKMRDINLLYSLPHSVVEKVKADDITFRITISNILLWTANKYGIDPEFHDAAAGARVAPTGQHSITIGANLRF